MKIKLLLATCLSIFTIDSLFSVELRKRPPIFKKKFNVKKNVDYNANKLGNIIKRTIIEEKQEKYDITLYEKFTPFKGPHSEAIRSTAIVINQGKKNKGDILFESKSSNSFLRSYLI